MKKAVAVLFSSLFFSTILFSQNLVYVKGIIDTLASPGFYGRGYVNNGDRIAADFIVKHLKKDKLLFFTPDAFQPFGLNVNTFPGALELSINGIVKTPGADYMVAPNSQTMNHSYKTLVLNEKTMSTPRLIKKFNKRKVSNIALVVDTGFKDLKNIKIQETPLLVIIRDKGISWHVSNEQSQKKYAEVIINRSTLPKEIKKVSVNIEARQQDNYQTRNVVGYISGKVYPDSFVVFGAHYDHLGMMGDKTFFPGANDNGSGTAMLLDLAAYYSKPENQPDYSMAFIFFSGEEAGLLGSEYFTEHPLFPLKNIKFMLNLDMVGTGSEGIKVVNGSIFKPEFEKLKALNEKGGYVKSVNERGEAANSDHYHFYKKGVKCFFIYTLGSEYKEYHTVGDKAAGLPLTKYTELFRLVCDFVKNL
jgi:aminopeptidase YwaD